jgi:hypothetical protein
MKQVQQAACSQFGLRFHPDAELQCNVTQKVRLGLHVASWELKSSVCILCYVYSQPIFCTVRSENNEVLRVLEAWSYIVSIRIQIELTILIVQ